MAGDRMHGTSGHGTTGSLFRVASRVVYRTPAAGLTRTPSSISFLMAFSTEALPMVGHSGKGQMGILLKRCFGDPPADRVTCHQVPVGLFISGRRMHKSVPPAKIPSARSDGHCCNTPNNAQTRLSHPDTLRQNRTRDLPLAAYRHSNPPDGNKGAKKRRLHHRCLFPY